ncbi:MAG: hypothetical protein H7A23_15255 [Leptospiraceae bacterium]|nr:hypothetical protein [Leptospiraceae bacterium]MCP5495908.1 hypothetical protein [Leptospiraceae bacterium]
MQNAYILTGFLKSPNLIELDESLSFSFQKVRIIVEPLQIIYRKKSLLKTLETIQNRQKSRNYIPQLKEEVDKYITELRGSWD